MKIINVFNLETMPYCLVVGTYCRTRIRASRKTVVSFRKSSNFKLQIPDYGFVPYYTISLTILDGVF